ncbi:MAG: iron transporter [Halobacteria archaeon]
MNRRSFVSVLGGTAFLLAGCLETRKTRSGRSVVPQNRPNAVYVPTHVDGMVKAASKEYSGYRVRLFYTLPHVFWTVTGGRTNRVEPEDDDTVHFMAVVTDADTGTVMPSANVSAALRKDGELVADRELWPMVSERMGFHYGDNIPLSGSGSYEVNVEVTPPTSELQGGLADRFGEVSEGSLTFSFSEQKLGNLKLKKFDKAGDIGAVDPMKGASGEAVENSRLEEVTGVDSIIGSETSGDAEFTVFTGSAFPETGNTTVVSGRNSGGDGNSDRYKRDLIYLGVIPTTPYNRFVLSRMSLSVSYRDGDGNQTEINLEPKLNPGTGYHYGASVPNGVDRYEVSVRTPPQLARHQGYEKAFLEFDTMEFIDS